ncbi:VOC family protein [Streptomyces sp. NPDC048718]|uniref:VOC family protein n=1 Tax=Streptomyces sp. NPDC048718 TaxID=3365587 RepID=UPI003717E7BD
MGVHAQGTPSWVEAQLPDLEAGRRFYGGLFGWSFDDDRHEALLDGRRVAGIIPKRDGRMPTTWTLYLAASDAGTVAARIKDAGGRMVMEPYPVGPFGVRALAADPGGAVFGVRQAGDENGFAVTGEPGSFCWVEVHTRAPDAVDTFYATVFGWLGHHQTEPGPAAADYRLWSPPGTRSPDTATAFGGRAVMPAAVPAAFPGHLLVHFAARDCDETCDTAARLGGRIVLAPRDTPHGRTAVLDDDQGARFAILTRS